MKLCDLSVVTQEQDCEYCKIITGEGGITTEWVMCCKAALMYLFV